jgi:AmmeMemoRadiSam system protein B
MMNRGFSSKPGAASLDVRPSPIAGQWYAGEPALLRKRVQDFLDAAEVETLDGSVVALISPHAGHRYSGGVAAYAYRLVQGASYDFVAIVAPNHRIDNYSPYLVTAHAAYWTPLGEVPLATDLLDTLDARLGLSRVQRDLEHSIEIQLPFLQVALAKSSSQAGREQFQLVPLMLNDPSREACHELGQALAGVLRDRNALLIASTDLSHFYNAETAARLDGAVTDCIAAFDPEGLLDVMASGKGQACGGGPTVAVMLAAQALGANRSKLLKYATSGDVTGDFHSVVGYAAAVLYKGGTSAGATPSRQK